MITNKPSSDRPSSDQFNYLESEGFENCPDYEGYRRDIRALQNTPLSADDYEKAARLAAERRGI